MNATKDRILDAADRVVLRDGVGKLTLDAVAAEAGLSKGGVLYNFPTKDDLIRGMIHRLVHLFESMMTQISDEDPEPAGRRTRAILKASFPEPDSQNAHLNDVSAALLAAIATNPGLLEPLREHFRAWNVWIMEDGIDPVNAALVRLAAEGLWLGDLFRVNIVAPEMRRKVIRRLQDLTRDRSQHA